MRASSDHEAEALQVELKEESSPQPGSEAHASTPRRRRRRDGSRGAAVRSPNQVLTLLAAATALSLLALGTVHVLALLAVAPLALASGVVALHQDRTNRVAAPAVVLVALAGYSALQAMPMPIGVLRLLDKQTASIWETALQPFAENVTTGSLSLDPGASLVESLKWLSYAAVFVAGGSVAVRAGLRRIAALVFGAALLAAVVTLGHRLVGAEAFFGIYRPVYAAPKFATAPLLNANNLAGYLNLGAFAGLGLMVARRPLLRPWIVGLGVAVVVGLSAVSGSRAGLAALLAASAVLVVGLRSMRFDGLALPRIARWLVTSSVLAGLVLFVLAADREVWRALFTEGAQKLALISWTKPMVANHPWFGVGRGAFETAFPAYRADEGHHLYQFAENFVMQWACEWGLPVSLAAQASFAWLFRPSRLGIRRSGLAFATYVGVIALLAQNLLDLGLEVAAVCIPLFALLGALWATATNEQQPTVDLGWARQPGVALAVAGLTVWSGAVLAGARTAIRDRRAVADAFRELPSASSPDSPAAEVALKEQLRIATHRHPADPFLPLVGALAARLSHANPLPWLSRAIERDPMAGRPFLLLADVLGANGNRAQALLSVRQAVEREQALAAPGISLALQLTRDPGELARAAPDGLDGANMLSAMANVPDAREIRPELLELAIARDPKLARPRIALAEDLLRALETKQPPCEPEAQRCRDRVRELAAAVENADRSQEAPVILNARLLALSGELADGVKFLSTNCSRFSPGIECLRWQITLGAKARDWIAVEKAGQSYLAASCENPNACAAAAFWLGTEFEQVGNDLQALTMFERAGQEGESRQAWDRAAKVATRLGFVGAAKRDRERAGKVPSPTPDARKDAETARERLRQLVEDKAQP